MTATRNHSGNQRLRAKTPCTNSRYENGNKWIGKETNMFNQWTDWCRSAMTALLTICAAATAFAQPLPRIGDNSSDFGDFNRVIRDDISRNTGFGTNPLGTTPHVDLSRVDKRVVQNLLNESVAESDRLYRALQQDYQRYPEIRPFLSDLISMRARASRAAQDMTAAIPLEQLLPQFQQMGSDWRLLSHQMSQSRQLGRTSLDSIDRIDRLVRELEKVFQMEPQLNRRELLTEFARLDSALRNLVQELEMDPTPGDKIFQLTLDARKLNQQAYRIQQMVLDQATYTAIVAEYNRLETMLAAVVPNVRLLNNRFLERSMREITLADSRLHDLLWLEQQTSRDELRQIANALMRDVDEFYNRVPLKLLLSFKDVASILQTADDFYVTVQNFRDCVDRNENEQSILQCYRYVEEQGLVFTRAFQPLKSSAGKVVLREIEDGVLALRNELNLSGTVTTVDTRALTPTAASLELYAEHLELDVKQWLSRERPAFSSAALQAAAKFKQRAAGIHRMLQARPSTNQLKTEISDLSEEFRLIYQYLGQCRTADREHMRNLALDIGQAINTLRAPLQI